MSKEKTAAELLIEQTKQDIKDTLEGRDINFGGDDDDGEKNKDGSKKKDAKKSDDDKTGEKTGDDKGADKSKGEDDKGEEDVKGGEGDGDKGEGDKDKSGDKDKGGSDDKGGEGDGDELTPEQSRIKELEDQNAALFGKIDDLASAGLRGYKEESASDGTGDETGKSDDKGTTDIEPKSVAFIANEEELRTVLETPDGLNTLLNKVANTAALAGEERGYTRAIKDIPAVSTRIADQQISAKEVARDFLLANEDLIPFRNYIAMKSNELQAKNPDWKLDKIFTEAGKATREELKLSKVVKETNDKDGAGDDDNVGLPGRGAGGGGQGKSKEDKSTGMSDMQKQIGDLVDFAEGSTNRR